MTASRTREANGTRPWRALTAVLALYALVLQAVLGGAAAAPGKSPFNVICLSQADGSGDADPAAPQDSGHHEAGCCTLCHPAAASAPPMPAATAIVWPAGAVSRLAWQADDAFAARALPPAEARPRAPPVV